MAFEDKRIAIVCDWLKDWGGAEQVLYDLLEAFPQADVYASVFHPQHFPELERRGVRTTFIDRIPWVRSRPKLVPFLRPYAFEGSDFSEYDVVISSASAEAKGIVTRPETLHVCYCHSLTRYYWGYSREYVENPEFGILNPLARLVMPYFFHRLRIWDFVAASRVDAFVANSQNIANGIAKYYRRESEIVTPGIDTETFSLETDKEDYYLAVGRMVPYKRFDLLVDAFNESGKPLVIVTNTPNALMKSLMQRSKPNIEWQVDIPHEKKIRFYQKARALLFPQEENFGMVPVEAMLCGTPVIAFGRGGALETVREGLSGTFFYEQNPEGVNAAVERFEALRFSAYDIRKYALKFDREIFKMRMVETVASLLR